MASTMFPKAQGKRAMRNLVSVVRTQQEKPKVSRVKRSSISALREKMAAVQRQLPGVGQSSRHNPMSDLEKEDESDERFQADFTEKGLLELSETIRRTLFEERDLGRGVGAVYNFLSDLLIAECNRKPLIELDLIKATHLDKLLVDLQDASFYTFERDIRILPHVVAAQSLEKGWLGRFKEAYASLDYQRTLKIEEKGGRLENVIFQEDQLGGCGWWKVKNGVDLPEMEDNTDIKEGHWWVNLACAQRDGIVYSPLDVVSKGKYGMAALPLCSGGEIAQWPSATVKYQKEGKMADMCLPLLTQVGSRVRVLRGSGLKSPFAPRAGVRYDGHYIIRQYGQKRNQLTGTFRLTLELQRVDGQRPMHEICQIPRPIDVDDWRICENIEKEVLGKKLDDKQYQDWARRKALNQAEDDRFQRTLQREAMNFIESIRGEEEKGVTAPGDLKGVQKLSDLKWER